jgi:hypothetical protein
MKRHATLLLLLILFSLPKLYSQDITAKKEREFNFPKKVLLKAINSYLKENKQKKSMDGNTIFTINQAALSSDDPEGAKDHTVMLKLQATGKTQCLLTVSCVTFFEKQAQLIPTIGGEATTKYMYESSESVCDEVMSDIIDKIR